MSAVIMASNLKKYFDTGVITKAIDNVSLLVEQGEFLSVMGSSGSGKSTLLNLLAGLEVPTSGKVLIENADLFKMKSKDITMFRKQNMGFIFQDLNLLDTLTLYENVELVLEINKTKTQQNKKKIIEYAEILGIANVLQAYPYHVSGGQKQRCACIRAIINNPQIIFADEPTGSLDSISRRKFMELLVKIARDTRIAIVMVTHDVSVASYSDRMLFLKDGKIQQEINNNGDGKKYSFELRKIAGK